MKEVLLCKYGEVVLKGLNRSHFESILQKQIKHRIAPYGDFEIQKGQSTLYVEPKDPFANIDLAFEAAKKVFGFVRIARAIVVEKDIEAIKDAVRTYIPPFMAGAKTFKAEAKRADKRFALTSPQIAAAAGGALLEVMPSLKVDVKTPDITIMIEIREYGAYIHAGAEHGAGGLPVGSSGKSLLLLSGGIDSPVAGYRIARRGAIVEAVHFESFPYTSERAKEKVLSLAKIVSEYAGPMRVHVLSLTRIQEELKRHCTEDYFTLLLRRSMMRLACRTAEVRGCHSLITGESLGQVASQTMQALSVTDAVADRPVLRPCIGMDKEEIVETARHIGTFETSILPYEDCCTVFTPKHPKTKPELAKVLDEEAKIDFAALEDEAFAALETIWVQAGE